MKRIFAVVLAALLSWTAAGDPLLVDPKPGSKPPKWHPHGLTNGISRSQLDKIMKIEFGKKYAGGYAIIVIDRWSDLAPYVLQEVPVPAARTYRFSGRVTVDNPCTIRFGIQYCSPDGDGSWRHESSKGCTKTLKLQPGTTAFSLVYTPPAQGERCQLMPYVSPTTGKPEEKGRIRLEDLKLEEIAQEKPQQPQKEGNGS